MREVRVRSVSLLSRALRESERLLQLAFTPASRLPNSPATRCQAPSVLVRQARKNRLVYVILAKCRLVLPEAQAPQPDHNVHEGAPSCGLEHTIVRWNILAVKRMDPR
jgi:hypothetical protein